VELNWSGLAYVSFAGIQNYKKPPSNKEVASAAKGAKPVAFQLDDIHVCVPDDDV